MNDDPPDLEPIDLASGGTSGSVPGWGSGTPAGWYPDPWTPGQQRFWDGAAWTAQVQGSPPVMSGWAVPPGLPRDLPPLPPARDARSARTGAIVAGLIALSLLSGAVGYAIESATDSNDGRNSAREPATAAPDAEEPAIQDQAALADLVVQQSDVRSPRLVVLLPNGNRTSTPTLDLCNGRFASERQRVARLQVAALDTNGDVVLSTEAVTYRRVADGAKAVAELRSVRRGCPNEPVPSPDGDGTAEFEFKTPPDGAWKDTPAVERLAYSFTATAAGATESFVTVYLRRGRVLMGLYFYQPTGPQPAVGGKRSIEEIVALFEARIARLPAKIAGA